MNGGEIVARRIAALGGSTWLCIRPGRWNGMRLIRVAAGIWAGSELPDEPVAGLEPDFGFVRRRAGRG